MQRCLCSWLVMSEGYSKNSSTIPLYLICVLFLCPTSISDNSGSDLKPVLCTRHIPHVVPMCHMCLIFHEPPPLFTVIPVTSLQNKPIRGDECLWKEVVLNMEWKF